MTDLIEKEDLAALMGDKEFRKAIVGELIHNKELVNDITGKTVDLFSDVLKEHPEYKRAIVKELVTSPTIRKALARKTVGRNGWLGTRRTA